MNDSRATILTTLPTVRMPLHTKGNQPILQLFVADPFRPFFIFGWIISLIGLVIWPLYFSGAIKTYPGLSHAYLMVQFFVTPFAVGFLWTALPRMLEVPDPGPRFIISRPVRSEEHTAV